MINEYIQETLKEKIKDGYVVYVPYWIRGIGKSYIINKLANELSLKIACYNKRNALLKNRRWNNSNYIAFDDIDFDLKDKFLIDEELGTDQFFKLWEEKKLFGGVHSSELIGKDIKIENNNKEIESISD
jgi:hypothetical protein